MKYCHLFGPVASRRLGISLGVDLVVHKVCSLDCVYCECGRTTELTRDRKAWVPFERVKAELDHYFDHNDDPDYITFSGAGEPCLNQDLGRVIAYIKERKPGIKVAVLTNGTLLSDPGVRLELALADLVVPSLDGVSQAVFQQINRPHTAIGPEPVIQGIRDFVRGFGGRVHLEIFILPGVNDTPEELALFRQAIEEIGPDLVQLNALDRPGAEAGLKTADPAHLLRIRQILGPDRVEIIARTPDAGQRSGTVADLEAAVLQTIDRRPSTTEDLCTMLGADPKAVQSLLDQLLDQGRVRVRKETRGRFYQTIKGSPGTDR